MNATVEKNFKLGGYDFTLNYIDDNKKIGVSFNQTFRFTDFLYVDIPPKGSAHLEPVDGRSEKILAKCSLQHSVKKFFGCDSEFHTGEQGCMDSGLYRQ
jgi:hypothetical protein